MTQQHLNFQGREGCCRCGKTKNSIGTDVTWRCCVCNGLVCMDCCLTMPLSHPDYSGIPGTRFERQYYDDTYCSERCRTVEQGEKELTHGRRHTGRPTPS